LRKAQNSLSNCRIGEWVSLPTAGSALGAVTEVLFARMEALVARMEVLVA
jgi:hypothetical protein